MSTNQEKTFVKYLDVCKETLDGIAANNRKTYETFFNELSQGVDKNKLFCERKSILCPPWCFEPNTLGDLKRMGYLVEDKETWSITQKGYRFACSASFYFKNGEYVINIHDQAAVDDFWRDLKTVC